MKDMRGKTAFVTGAASGIGLRVAHALAGAGARLVLADINSQGLATAVEAISNLCEVPALGVELDVRSVESWTAAADRAEQLAGDIHIFCCNAGIAGGIGMIEERSLEDLDTVWEINARGMFLGVKTLLPRMKRHGGSGHIVVTSSMMGLFSKSRIVVYAMSKYAALALAETLFLELRGTPLGASVLCPGAVNTGLISNASRHLPSQRGNAANAGTLNLLAAGMDPDKVGERVVQAIINDEFYIITHPEYQPFVVDRTAMMMAAFGHAKVNVNADDLTIYENYSNAL